MRNNKFGVSPKQERTWYGKVYDSKLEMKYAQHLDLLKHATGNDQVLDVKEQIEYPIFINNILVFKYRIDFVVKYPNRTEYVDVKGLKTPLYSLKKKCFEAYYGWKIKEVYKGQF